MVSVGRDTEYGVHDTFRQGFRSVRSEIVPQHPLENIAKNWKETHDQLQMTTHRQTFGLHAPLRLQMEKAIVSQIRRIPVLPTRNLGLDILEGRDSTIDYEDFLGDPSMPTALMDPHVAMEHALGMGSV
ncbi:proteasome maturation factor UMP1 [Fimicolochytrium jonesii]|uniref:proteasome maturation factor UMP1 n=1 Tax=Fimicolochytrium jonesii TaxID=1396493 RepID=UPI0022FE6D85|nr:proteasome maturation factor UMP1 [Fimicolochytrium jonesii]KAI8824150.1 proteasome maturation factor UMP1 [Fimicolochytrium jonesii]